MTTFEVCLALLVRWHSQLWLQWYSSMPIFVSFHLCMLYQPLSSQISWHAMVCCKHGLWHVLFTSDALLGWPCCRLLSLSRQFSGQLLLSWVSLWHGYYWCAWCPSRFSWLWHIGISLTDTKSWGCTWFCNQSMTWSSLAGINSSSIVFHEGACLWLPIRELKDLTAELCV